MSGLGRDTEAAAATSEAVAIRRRLASANPAAYGPDLARSLSNLGVQLSATGRDEEALAAAQEAVTAYRQLVQARPEAFAPELARSLMALASIRALSPAGPVQALHAIHEAAGLYLQLSAQAPEVFTARLTAALGAAADLLDLLGQASDARALRRLAGAGSLAEATSLLQQHLPGG